MTNDFKAFAVDPGANVQPQVDYAADDIVTDGFQSGVAPSEKFNKVMRQGTVGTAALAEFIIAQLGGDVLDDGNLSSFVTKLTNALKAVHAVPTMQVFTASGTWTKPAGLRAVDVITVGGGGGGGGAAATSGTQCSSAGGGGGGGYSRKRILENALGATETVTVGAGGAGGASGANTGGTGGTSSFGSHLQATGGIGGTGGTTAAANDAPGLGGGQGGIGSNGNINVRGGPGMTGGRFPSSGHANGGEGGNSALGGGGQSADIIGTTDPGVAGGNYGGGASGAANGLSQSAAAGQAGAPGIVIVMEYY